MTQILRQSTAVDVLIGPFVDNTDARTAETGETIVAKLSKNGQGRAAKNDATAPAHDSAGYYNCELDATDTNTVGTLVITATSSTALPVRQEFQVVEEAVYDLVWAGSATLKDSLDSATGGIAALETSLTFATGSIDQLLLDVADVDAGVSTATDALSALSTGGGHAADLIETVDTVVDGLRVSMDYATDTLSYLSTGGGPFPGGGSAPTATEVANAVLSQTSADHTADGTFGGDVLGSLQSATDQISQLAVDLSAIETSITYATKGIDQANIGIATATDVLSALATGGGASAISVPDILTTQMTESYAADGTAPTLAQALFLIQQELGDFAINGTTLTVRQLDGSTTAATFTLDDASAPTSKTRSG